MDITKFFNTLESLALRQYISIHNVRGGLFLGKKSEPNISESFVLFMLFGFFTIGLSDTFLSDYLTDLKLQSTE